MTSFFSKLKIVFEKIPIKARFLKDMGLNISYSGFRYFMQGRKDTPSKKLIEKLCANMEYEYVTIPIKINPESQLQKTEIENQFFKDLDIYLKRYADDQTRTYAKEFGNESSVAKALAAFAAEEEFKPDSKVDLSDLF